MAATMWKLNNFVLYSQQCRNIHWKFRKQLLQHLKSRQLISFEQFRTNSTLEARAGTSSFESWIADQKARARKSVIVKIPSRNTIDELHKFCTTYVPESKITYCRIPSSTEIALVEFETEEQMQHVLKHAVYAHENPVYSHFLYFNSTENVKDPAIVNEYSLPAVKTVDKNLRSAKNVSHQMQLLHEETKLSDIGSLLRFMVCVQLETAFAGIFPNGEIKPFGSSINGLGKFDSDLDMVYDVELQYLQQGKPHSPLRFQPTFAPPSSMTQAQQNLYALKDFIRVFLPCCTEVLGILKARVPIIKFQHIHTGLECDLSMHNLTGVYMSELLHLYGECDERVRPLVFTVVRWAKENAITHDSGGHWFTNFHLTLLVLFFLQQQKILPPLKSLITRANKLDERITNGINCTFLRDKSKLPRNNNKATLHELLMDFFNFYSTFDFGDRRISLIDGRAGHKTKSSPVEIENPLEMNLNATQVVNRPEVKRLQDVMQEGAWILEKFSTRDPGRNWGILRMFEPLPTTKNLFHVHDFFHKDERSNKKQAKENGNTATNTTKYTYVAE